MVVMAAIFIRQQPTFVELLGDNQNNGKFISIFFLNYPNRISIFISSRASLAVLKGSARMDRFRHDGFAVTKTYPTSSYYNLFVKYS